MDASTVEFMGKTYQVIEVDGVCYINVPLDDLVQKSPADIPAKVLPDGVGSIGISSGDQTLFVNTNASSVVAFLQTSDALTHYQSDDDEVERLLFGEPPTVEALAGCHRDSLIIKAITVPLWNGVNADLYATPTWDGKDDSDVRWEVYECIAKAEEAAALTLQIAKDRVDVFKKRQATIDARLDQLDALVAACSPQNPIAIRLIGEELGVIDAIAESALEGTKDEWAEFICQLTVLLNTLNNI